MAKTQFYVKFVTMTGGGAPVYICTDAISGFTTEEVYYTAKVSDLNLTGQTVSPLDGTNTFSTLTFVSVDPKKTGASDTGAITAMLFTYKHQIYKTVVEFYEVTGGGAFGAGVKKFTGYLSKVDRISGGWSFECESKFARASQNPITFPTGSFQVKTAFDYDKTRPAAVILMNGVNVSPGTRTNILTGGTVWTNDTTVYPGSAWTNLTGLTPTNNNTAQSQCYTDITVGSAAGNMRLGVCYTFYTSVQAGQAGAVLSLTASGYAGSTLVDTQSSGDATIAFPGGQYTGVMYVVADPRITKVRLEITVDDSGTVGPSNSIVTTYFSVSNTWLLNRELIDILNYDTTTGKAALAGRGGLGSLPAYHGADEQGIRVTILAGHPLNVAQRLFLTTSTEGQNGTYDPGDGLGVGTEITSAMIGPSWASEQTYTLTGTLFEAWNVATVYVIGDVVSGSSKNWYRLTAGSGGATPSEGADWTEIMNPFDGYNFKYYDMLFMISEKMENPYEWVCGNIMKPIHANMFEDANGLLGVTMWRHIGVAGSGTLGEANRKYDGEIPMTTDRESVINKVIYRMDYDPLGACDIQGNQSGGSNNLPREFVLTEPSFGEDSTTASSAALYGNRELEIESVGARGAYSTRFGYLGNLGNREHTFFYGDQMAYETARRILTRYRLPVDVYDFAATLSKRTIGTGDVVAVTHPNMLNMTTGTWGRTASPMSVVESETDYASAVVNMKLRADGDCIAIPNTTVITPVLATPIPATPSVNPGIFTSIPAKMSITSTDLPIYPKGFSIIVDMTITAETIYDLLIYCYTTRGGAAPSTTDFSAFQYIGEIPVGGTYFYHVITSPATATVTCYYRCRYRNADREVGRFSGLVNGAGITVNTGTSRLNRGPKLEIRQLSGDGQAVDWRLGSGPDSGPTNFR